VTFAALGVHKGSFDLSSLISDVPIDSTASGCYHAPDASSNHRNEHWHLDSRTMTSE
jgi:hypothetical protein